MKDIYPLQFENKVHPMNRPLPITPLEQFTINGTPLSPINNITRVKLQRPFSTDLKRTISTIDQENLSHMTHRRTQSYADSTSLNRQQQALG